MRVTYGALPLIIASAAWGQPAGHMGHGHGGANVLFLAKADSAQVVPVGTSSASATAAFVFSKVDRTFHFDLTYAGLEHSGAQSIGLFNFGIGGNGKMIARICGAETIACPVASAARMEGMISRLEVRPTLLSEFASGRVYLQIDGGNGAPEIRGQLNANGAMVPSRSYIAKLVPSDTAGASGEGTAILSETYLPGDRVAVEYSITVAGTSGVPQDAALVGVPQNQSAASIRFLSAGRLAGAEKALNGKTRVGSFSGTYVVSRSSNKSIFAERLFVAGARTPGIAIRTSRFPKGELTGVFVPVN